MGRKKRGRKEIKDFVSPPPRRPIPFHPSSFSSSSGWVPLLFFFLLLSLPIFLGIIATEWKGRREWGSSLRRCFWGCFAWNSKQRRRRKEDRDGEKRERNGISPAKAVSLGRTKGREKEYFGNSQRAAATDGSLGVALPVGLPSSSTNPSLLPLFLSENGKWKKQKKQSPYLWKGARGKGGRGEGTDFCRGRLLPFRFPPPPPPLSSQVPARDWKRRRRRRRRRREGDIFSQERRKCGIANPRFYIRQ